MENFTKRRRFLQGGFLSCVIVATSGCGLFDVSTLRTTISTVQHDLFPKAKELGIDTSRYITIVFRHSRIGAGDKDFLKNGAKWLNESALEMFEKPYVRLHAAKRQEVLNSIAQTQWGERWIYTMITYILEAMLADPVYGGNNNEIAWEWLAFKGGFPHPTKAYL